MCECAQNRRERERERATSYPAEGPRLTAFPPLLRLRRQSSVEVEEEEAKPMSRVQSGGGGVDASSVRPTVGRRAPMVPGNEVQIRSLGAGRDWAGDGCSAYGGGSVGYMLRKALLGHPRRCCWLHQWSGGRELTALGYRRKVFG